MSLAVDLALSATLGLIVFLLGGEWIGGLSVAVLTYIVVCVAGVVIETIRGGTP